MAHLHKAYCPSYVTNTWQVSCENALYVRDKNGKVKCLGNVVDCRHTTKYKLDNKDKATAAFMLDCAIPGFDANPNKFVVTHGNYGNDIKITGVIFKVTMHTHTQECITNNNYSPQFLKNMINQNSIRMNKGLQKKTPTKKVNKKDKQFFSSTSSGSSSSSSGRSDKKSDKTVERSETIFGSATPPTHDRSSLTQQQKDQQDLNKLFDEEPDVPDTVPDSPPSSPELDAYRELVKHIPNEHKKNVVVAPANETSVFTRVLYLTRKHLRKVILFF